MANGWCSIFVFGAGESDVGMVGACFRDETAWGGGGDDGLLKNEQDRRGSDLGEEDSCMVEDAG